MRIKHGEIRNVYKNSGKLHTAGWLERSTPVLGMNYTRSGSKQTDILHFLYRLIFCLNTTIGKLAELS
jgi:hypothetical protein